MEAAVKVASREKMMENSLANPQLLNTQAENKANKHQQQHFQSNHPVLDSPVYNLQMFLALDQDPGLCWEKGGRRRRTEAESPVFDLNMLDSKSGVVQSATYLIGKVAFELGSLLLMIFSSKKTPAFSIKYIGLNSRLLFLCTPNPSS